MVISIFAPTIELDRSRWSAITTAAGADRPPSMRGYKARKDDIAPTASASATPVHHSRSQSPLRKSKPKSKQPTFEMFPRLPERSSRTHSHLFVASTSRSAAPKLLSDDDEVCATWCLKIGRHPRTRSAAKSSSFYQNSTRRHHEPSFIALQMLPAWRLDDRRSFIGRDHHHRRRAPDTGEITVVIRSIARRFHRGKVERLA